MENSLVINNNALNLSEDFGLKREKKNTIFANRFFKFLKGIKKKNNIDKSFYEYRGHELVFNPGDTSVLQKYN